MRAALLSLALALAALAASAQGIEALEAQLDKAREAAPMAIKPFLVVSRPAKHFGDFEERPAKEFRRGEKMHFYAEPRNLSQPKTAAGTYEPALEVDIEVQGEKGESMKQPRFMSMRIPSKSRINDLFLNLEVSLTGAPAGKYTIKFIFRDLNSKKVATVEQPVTIK